MTIDKRIFFYSSIQSSVLQYAARDMAHGFRCIGWDVEMFRERWPGEQPIGARALAETALWFRPSIIFCVDGVRGQNPELWPLFSSYVCWAQDALPQLLDPKMAQAMLPHDLVLTSFPGLAQRFIDKTFKPEQIRHLSVGVNNDLFAPTKGYPDEWTVGFPANIGHPGHGKPQERYDYYAEPVRWLIEAGVKIKLWGEGWQNPEFGQYWCGKVRNGPELADAYNECSAILHVNCDTNQHQRVYEGVATGRVVLYRRLPNDNHPDGIEAANLGAVRPFSTKEELIVLCKDLPSCGFSLDPQFRTRPHDYKERAKAVVRMVKEVTGA